MTKSDAVKGVGLLLEQDNFVSAKIIKLIDMYVIQYYRKEKVKVIPPGEIQEGEIYYSFHTYEQVTRFLEGK